MDKKNALYIVATIAVAVVALLVFAFILMPAGPEGGEDEYGYETRNGNLDGGPGDRVDSGSAAGEARGNGNRDSNETGAASESEFRLFGQVLDMESR